MDLDVLQEMLTAAVVHHVSTYPDDEDPERIAAYLAAVMRQVGYRAVPGEREKT
ncbi:hypothetical protein ACFQYP_25580 [Nonomuraea antimicrobica]